MGLVTSGQWGVVMATCRAVYVPYKSHLKNSLFCFQSTPPPSAAMGVGGKLSLESNTYCFIFLLYLFSCYIYFLVCCTNVQGRFGVLYKCGLYICTVHLAFCTNVMHLWRFVQMWYNFLRITFAVFNKCDLLLIV